MLKSNRYLLLALGAFLALPALPVKASPEVSLETAILFALDKNPEIHAEMEKIKQAHAAIDEARADYYPQVSLKIKSGHEDNYPASLPTNTLVVGHQEVQTNSAEGNLVVSQILYNGFATDEEVGRRKALEKSAGFSLQNTIEKKISETIVAYSEIWQHQREVEESKAHLANLQKIGEKVALMKAAGAESKAKKEYVDSRVAAAQSDLTRAQASLTESLSSLEALTGSLPPFKARRPEQLDPTLREIESYYHLADTSNAKLQMTSSDLVAADHQIEAQRSSYYPTVHLDLNGREAYDVGGKVGNAWNASAMVVLDYKLFDGFLRDSTLSRLQSQKAETELRRQEMIRDLYKDIRKSYNQIVEIKQDLESNAQEILTSETLQDLYQKQFELGEGDIINMIEGYERLHNARLKSYKLEANLVMNGYALLQKAGALKKERFCASC